MKRQRAWVFLGGLLLVILTGCAPRTVVRTETVPLPVEPLVTERPAGTVEYVWEEPMVNVVEVPPGLDPEGHYYRPAHRAVQEIRQGRWKHYGEK